MRLGRDLYDAFWSKVRTAGNWVMPGLRRYESPEFCGTEPRRLLTVRPRGRPSLEPPRARPVRNCMGAEPGARLAQQSCSAAAASCTVQPGIGAFT